MTDLSPFFFCAVGGSGMMPLALLMQARGVAVSGSDRGYDQGRTPARFEFLKKQGITLFAQDGSGLKDFAGRMVVSTAVEDEVADVRAAKAQGVPIIHRAALLAEMFNQAEMRLGIAGTSGKSTTTAMAGWILHQLGQNPTIVNGAVMKNFVHKDVPFASSVVGNPDLFVTEIDESDGSIARFSPVVAVINNISLDHKSMEELQALFAAFAAKAKTAVFNLDDPLTNALMLQVQGPVLCSFSLQQKTADFFAEVKEVSLERTVFTVTRKQAGEQAEVSLPLIGQHNVQNALAALAACCGAGVDFAAACAALSSFKGTARRLDVIGAHGGVTVIDDFAHNPDKIRATLRALHQFDGRILALFQPHGFGSLKLLKNEFAQMFAQELTAQDKLWICDPLYLGGTVSKEVSSADLVAAIGAENVVYVAQREEAALQMLQQTASGDRLLIMGARDDTLTQLARDILEHVIQKISGSTL